MSLEPDYNFTMVDVRIEGTIAWVRLNRPEKRNAMSPTLNREMIQVLDLLEQDDRVSVVVLTGAGDAFSSGMDIKEYFRETDGLSPIARRRIYREAAEWQWRRLRLYPKPTIAMVNGWCLGGAFTPLIACDLAVAAEEAKFGLSEINWGIIPAGNVAKAISTAINNRQALYLIMTGELFTGVQAREYGLVNNAVPLTELKNATRALANTLAKKNPHTLRQAKISFKNISEMDWEVADDYLRAKQEEGRALDPENGREVGMRRFLDEKTYKPSAENYRK